ARIHLQIASPRVGLEAAGILDREKSLAADRQVEGIAGLLDRADSMVPTHGLVRCIDSRGIAGTGDRAALERAQVGLEARGARVREVVGVGSLCAQGLLRA